MNKSKMCFRIYSSDISEFRFPFETTIIFIRPDESGYAYMSSCDDINKNNTSFDFIIAGWSGMDTRGEAAWSVPVNSARFGGLFPFVSIFSTVHIVRWAQFTSGSMRRVFSFPLLLLLKLDRFFFIHSGGSKLAMHTWRYPGYLIWVFRCLLCI